MTTSIVSTRLDEKTERGAEGGYLQKKRFTFNDPQLHWLTKKGWEATGN